MARKKSKGTALQLEVATVMTTIVQLTGIDGPEAEVEDDDGTALDSVGPGREHEPVGWVEPGEVEAEGLFDPALSNHQLLTDLIAAPATQNWQILFSDATEWPFAGHLKKLGPTVELASLLRFNFSVKLKGIVDYPT